MKQCLFFLESYVTFCITFFSCYGLHNVKCVDHKSTILRKQNIIFYWVSTARLFFFVSPEFFLHFFYCVSDIWRNRNEMNWEKLTSERFSSLSLSLLLYFGPLRMIGITLLHTDIAYQHDHHWLHLYESSECWILLRDMQWMRSMVYDIHLYMNQQNGYAE